MSTAESEVAEAIADTEIPEPAIKEESDHLNDFDMDAAADQLSEELFGKKKEVIPEEVEPTEEEVAEVPEEVAEKPEEPEEPEKEPRAAPQSWKKDMHDAWNKLDNETQDYIELREEQMKEGVDVKKDDAELGMKMRDAIAPFRPMLQQQNIEETQAIKVLLGMHYKLSTAPPEEKKGIIQQIARNYGMGPEIDKDVDPQIKSLRQELNGVKQVLTQSQQRERQSQQTEIQKKVTAFAAEHDHFDDLSDEIAKLIRADYDLDRAYDIAYKASDYYQKDLDKEREKKEKEAEKAKKEEAEKAKKAKSVNVRGRDTKKAPTAPKGTMEDTLKDVMREIKNRT